MRVMATNKWEGETRQEEKKRVNTTETLQILDLHLNMQDTQVYHQILEDF